MMIDIVLEFHWSNNPIPIDQLVDKPDFIFEIPLGLITGFDAPVQSVNGKIGAVTLNHTDVGADPTGAADQVKSQLENNITQVLTLAQTNELKIGTKADQIDLENTQIQVEQNRLSILTKADIQALALLAQLVDTKADQIDLENTQIQVEQNRLSILTKADIQALAMLAQLVDTKADQAYVNQQIANLVGSAPDALNTIYELAAAIQNEQGLIDSLNQSVANRVRFDIATQALTEIQKQNARTNIEAEKVGTAQQLISQITAQSIGAATTAQGAKADTALQSSDVAPVAITGLFSSLASQNKIFDVLFNNYVLGANAEITAADTLGQMLAKLQAQIKNIGSSGSSGFNWVNADQISGLTLDSPVQHHSLKFAKKDGILWVCGSLRAQGATNASIKFFNISNSAYMVEQHVTNFFGVASQVAVCNITAHPITLGSPPSNVNALAMFYVLGTTLYLRTSYRFSSDGGFIAFKPTPIGRLV